jgi:Ser/Thr protein kinase RdoA (MazF antagonist)
VTDALEAVALEALRAYDVEVANCAFAAQAFNTIFRVDAADGSRYALRVGSELRIHADGCEEVESAWVNALRAAGFPVAQVMPARDGASVVDIGAHRCLLFEWVPGSPLRAGPSPEPVHQAGALTARVHDQAAGYLTDAPAGALVADRVLFLRAEQRLGELRPAYGTVLDEAVDRAQGLIDTLWREPPHLPHLLHGDVQPGNVMVDGDRVTLIDFQDLVWGFEIIDVVIARRAMPHGDAFRAGYETARPWPDADPETVTALSAARDLNVLNFGLSNRKAGLEAFVARHAEPVIAWMARGAPRP